MQIMKEVYQNYAICWIIIQFEQIEIITTKYVFTCIHQIHWNFLHSFAAFIPTERFLILSRPPS